MSCAKRCRVRRDATRPQRVAAGGAALAAGGRGRRGGCRVGAGEVCVRGGGGGGVGPPPPPPPPRAPPRCRPRSRRRRSPFRPPLAAESPLPSRWISEADSLLFYRLKKGACIYGSAVGEGFIMTRLPSTHPALIRWSAPLFLTIRYTFVGLSFGQQRISGFCAGMTSEARKAFTMNPGGKRCEQRKGAGGWGCEGAAGGLRVRAAARRLPLFTQTSFRPSPRRPLSGMDTALTCGSGLTHRADVLSAPTHGMGTGGAAACRRPCLCRQLCLTSSRGPPPPPPPARSGHRARAGHDAAPGRRSGGLAQRGHRQERGCLRP